MDSRKESLCEQVDEMKWECDSEERDGGKKGDGDHGQVMSFVCREQVLLLDCM